MAHSAAKNEASVVKTGWKAPNFQLMATDGKLLTLEDVRGIKGLLVIFMCNHCPYVLSALERIKADCSAMKELGIGVIAINANDTTAYPDDSFENMKLFAALHKLDFPYTIDETQVTARAYDAACTPEFYGFDANLRLAYHGRLDAGGSKQPPADAKRDLLDAMKMIAETGRGPTEQHSSIGCSIKWKH